MFRKSLKFSIAIVLIVSHITLVFGTGYAAAPTVKLIVNPNKTDVDLGSEPIALTAKASGSNLTYTWELQGPGKIEGEGSAVFYKLPDTIDGESAQALVTVTVTDATGQETTETVTFNILAPEKESAPQPAKKGMSKNTKIALGVGGVALLGGGIALAASGGGGGDSDSPPFTGSFKWEYTDVTSLGNIYTNSWVLNLTQDGNTITGNTVRTSTLVNCCTTVVTVPISGTADGNSAFFTWGGGEGSCVCTDWTWETWIDAGSGHATLVDNSIIRFDGGAEYIRMFIMGLSEIDHDVKNEITVPTGGDFIRQ